MNGKFQDTQVYQRINQPLHPKEDQEEMLSKQVFMENIISLCCFFCFVWGLGDTAFQNKILQGWRKGDNFETR